VLEDAGAKTIVNWDGSQRRSAMKRQALNFIVSTTTRRCFSGAAAVAATDADVHVGAERNGSAVVSVQLHDNAARPRRIRHQRGADFTIK